jgi:hypothetical protein
MQCWNPKFEKIKVWQIWSDSRLKWMKYILNLILSISMPYYQVGCNIDHLTRSKVLIDHPCEDPERKPLRTNLEILEWSSVDLMDQVESSKQGFGVLWPWPIWGTGLTGLGPMASLFKPTGLTSLGDRSDRSVLTEQQLVFGSGVFIPLSPLRWGLLVLGTLLSFLKHFLDQLALPNTLCELC